MSRLAAIALVACTVLPAGCAENQETLIVLLAPLWPDAGECTVGTGGDDALLFGVLDVAFGTPYLMPAIVLNNSATQATNDNNTGVVSNEIQLKDADVTIDSQQRAEGNVNLLDNIDGSLLDFTAPLSSNSIKPGQELGLVVEVLPSFTVGKIREQMRANAVGKLTVRANVAINGSRTGNDVGKIGKIKARDFSFPIQLCDGCLAYCDGCPTDITCPSEKPGFIGGVCGNAQDFTGVTPAGCEPPEE